MAGLDQSAADALYEQLQASEVWSLLLEVMDHRAGQRTPADLVRQWARDGFTRPAYVDQRTLVALDAHLLAAADRFEAIELSPLAPLGACSAVGLASQNKIVSALRGTEVVADPTNVLALECARRLRENPEANVRLATSHRCVRAQEVPKLPGFAPHFRIFCLATAGREQRDHAFLTDALAEHVNTMIGALERLEQHGYVFPDRQVRILATTERAPVADRVAAAVQNAPVTRDVLTHPYYYGLRYTISTRTATGDAKPLIDGGAFDWVGRLAANRRLVFVASGMGSQLIPLLFRAAART